MSKCVNCLKEINEKEVFCLTCHEEVLECAKQQIAELEEQLENYKLCRCVDCSIEYEKGLETSIDELENENQQLKQSQKQLAIEELKMFGAMLSRAVLWDNDYECWTISEEVYNSFMEQIEDKIKELKGEK